MNLLRGSWVSGRHAKTRGRAQAILVASAVAALLVAFGAGPTNAAAQTFTVDSTGDAPNTAIGASCETEMGKCTMRAAIEAANQRFGFDTVTFDTTVFTGEAAGTINPATVLPPITDPLNIADGCPTAENNLFPFGTCAGLDASGLATGFVVESDEVTIEGFAITGATIGIDVTKSADEFAARRDQLGADLAGAAGPNGTGIRLGPGSEDDRIGTYTTYATSGADLFVNNTEVGLDLEGASHTQVQDTRFGVLDGPAPNGTDIEISDVSTGGRVVKAIDNEIGAKKSRFAELSTGCLEGCNVIDAAVGDGIDLGGDGGVKLPASGPTRILGNVFGAVGSGLSDEAAMPNGDTAIEVGSADRVTIGGPLPISEGNHFVGGRWAVTAGPQEEVLAIEGNTVGQSMSLYPNLLEPPSEGAFSIYTWEPSNSETLPEIEGNFITMRGGVGILDAGGGAAIVENRIYGTDTGIRVEGERGSRAILVKGNYLEFPGEFGIDIHNWDNQITGNFVFGATRAGVRVESPGWTGGTEVYVGGDEAEEENQIEFSGGPAVEVIGEHTAFVDVLRNFGKNNAGPFVDLGADGLGNPVDGPNEGIQAPAILSATPMRVRGNGARAGGSRIRVFLKASSAPGEIEEFLSSATAAANGSWSVALPQALPIGTSIGVTETAYQGTSEMAIASITAEAATGQPGGNGGVTTQTVTVPSSGPDARILSGPTGSSARRHASFKIAAAAEDTLECSLDGTPFRLCHSPRTYSRLRPGRHIFRVRAVDPNGAVDSTPERQTFRIIRRPDSGHG